MENAIQERLRYLLTRYADQQNSQTEEQELFALLEDDATETNAKNLLLQMMAQEQPVNIDEQKWQPILQKILQTETRAQQATVKSINYRRWIYAAAIIVALALGSYAIFFRKTEKPTIAKIPAPVKTDIAPGGNKAVLTLADGSTMVLDSSKNGALAVQGNTQIIKGNGSLAYNEKQQVGIAQNTLYNTVSTPKGGQYQLTLADGSKVWLNAASSIRFPTSFNGKERIVEITGEAYFEVAHNAAKPFIVSVNDMQVEVLGTHFNINSYADEGSMKTTLLEGKVRVTQNGNIAVLKPGQQAEVNGKSSLSIHDGIDVDEVLAWKNGLFHFNNASLQQVMRQIVRWYNVDVVYQGNIPDRKFGGEISRNSNLSQVLKILEESKVHFTIEDKKLIVKP